jgi:S1-C subfamily serine protease
MALTCLPSFAGDQATINTYGAVFEEVGNGLRVSDVRPQRFVGQLGLKSGDVIQNVNGGAVSNQDAFLGKLRDRPEKISIGLMRNGSQKNVEALLYWPASVKDPSQQRNLDRAPPLILKAQTK